MPISCAGILPPESNILEQAGLQPQNYFLATVHRAENTDNPKLLTNIVTAFTELSYIRPLVWPLHPLLGKAWKRPV